MPEDEIRRGVGDGSEDDWFRDDPWLPDDPRLPDDLERTDEAGMPDDLGRAGEAWTPDDPRFPDEEDTANLGPAENDAPWPLDDGRLDGSRLDEGGPQERRRHERGLRREQWVDNGLPPVSPRGPRRHDETRRSRGGSRSRTIAVVVLVATALAIAVVGLQNEPAHEGRSNPGDRVPFRLLPVTGGAASTTSSSATTSSSISTTTTSASTTSTSVAGTGSPRRAGQDDLGDLGGGLAFVR